MTQTAHLIDEIRKLKSELSESRNNNIDLQKQLQRCKSDFNSFKQTCKEAVPITIDAWNQIVLSQP